uniref:MIF4G domain-containing protein n=1 Tax=Angiostrongylus cantonensis TaxID=6313 RepID=A0A158PAB5_ANGCA
MSTAATEGPPEAKKFRIDLPTQVVVEPSLCSTESLEGPAAAEGQSPAGPSSARSTNGSEISSESMEKDDEPEPSVTGNILEMISKSLLGNVFKLDDVSRPPRLPSVLASPVAAPIPGSVAVAQSPAAQLFSEVDYTRERYGGQLPSSPSSSACGSNFSSTSNNTPVQKVQKAKKEVKTDIPTSSANSATQAANQMLQHAGLTINASGQIMQSKKWRRDERRQRELEQRLAMALTTSYLGSEALANPLWRELLEAAQPKFTLNGDPQYFEQLIATLHARLLQSIRTLLASAVCVSVLVDCVRVTPSTGTDDPVFRLCVSAAFPAFINQKYEVQVVLLSFRPLVQADNTSESVAMTIDQVMSEYDLPQEKVTRIVCSGVKQLLDDDEVIDELKKSVYQMIFAFVTKQEMLQALNKAAGRSQMASGLRSHSCFELSRQAMLWSTNRMMLYLYICVYLHLT